MFLIKIFVWARSDSISAIHMSERRFNDAGRLGFVYLFFVLIPQSSGFVAAYTIALRVNERVATPTLKVIESFIINIILGVNV